MPGARNGVPGSPVSVPRARKGGLSDRKDVPSVRQGGPSARELVPSRWDDAPSIWHALPSSGMRLWPLLLLLLAVVACETGPAFRVPGGPPIPVALDVQFPVYTLGTWSIDEFSEELGRQLVKYNMRVVDRKTRPPLVAEINLGVLHNWHAIDVYLVRDGQTTPAGRVRVPDLSMPTLDASAQLVAPLIARQAWGLAAPSGLPRSE